MRKEAEAPVVSVVASNRRWGPRRRWRRRRSVQLHGSKSGGRRSLVIRVTVRARACGWWMRRHALRRKHLAAARVLVAVEDAEHRGGAVRHAKFANNTRNLAARSNFFFSLPEHSAELMARCRLRSYRYSLV